MRSLKSLISITVSTSVRLGLVASIALSPLAQAKFSDDSTDRMVNQAVNSPYEILTPELKGLALRRAIDAAKAPKWLKAIFNKKVESYFPMVLDFSKPLPQENLQTLSNEGARAFLASEEDAGPNSPYRDFIEKTWKPYVASLTPQQIKNYIQGKVMGQPVGGETVETTLTKRMMVHLAKVAGKGVGFGWGVLKTVAGPHMKYFKHPSTWLMLAGLGYYVMPEISAGTAMFMIGTVWFAIKAGPVASIFNAGLNSFAKPAKEQADVWGKRYFFKYEASVNAFFDGLNPKADQNSEPDSDRNDRVRIADLERDGTDIAGMSPEEQIENWEAGLKMFVAVAGRFGQLLRDTHHHGRDLMMLSWTDEQSVTQLVEIMDSKQVMFRGEVETLLTPHKTAFLMRNEVNRKQELEDRLLHFDSLSERVWLEPEMEDADRDALQAEIKIAVQRLVEMGLSTYEMDRILEIQKAKGKAFATMITALALGELRSFYHAERNRNLAEPARVIQLGIKKGLGKQDKVDKYLNLVQREHRIMGLKNAGKTTKPMPSLMDVPPSAQDKCENLLESANN